jgi:hypothetical protein
MNHIDSSLLLAIDVAAPVTKGALDFFTASELRDTDDAKFHRFVAGSMVLQRVVSTRNGSA